jgi:hypothetical protein
MKTKIENQKNVAIAIETKGVKVSDEALLKIERLSKLEDGLYAKMFNYFIEDMGNHLDEIKDVHVTFDGELMVYAEIKNKEFGDFVFYITNNEENVRKIELYSLRYGVYKKTFCIMPGNFKYFLEKLTKVSDDVDGWQKFKNGQFYIIAAKK